MVTRRTAKRQKAQQTIENRYDAAGAGRRIARWNPGGHGPQKAVAGVDKMRQRTHDAVRNDWAAESAVGKWTTTLVGTGIQPRWKADDIRPVWDRWGKAADADGALDIYGLEALMVRSWMEGGEVFIRRRPRVLGTKLPLPLQIQVIESEFVPIFDADTWTGMPAGNTIQQGIERDRSGQRIAYWVYKEHPGDGRNGAAPGSTDLVRVAASQMAHLYDVKRAGALRGVTPLASVLVRIRNSGDFEDAVLDRQKLANLFTMFITRSMPPEWADINFDPNTGLPAFYDQNGTTMVGLEPGMSQTLAPGEGVTFANPPEAGTTYPDYLRSTALGTASGTHMPYEFLTGDIKDVSDRTLRLVVQEFRRFAQQRQWLNIIPQALQRIADWFAEAAVLAGEFDLSRLDEIKAVEWAPHAWDYIHPTQDAQGKQMLLDMGVVSRTGLILERGDDPKKVLEQRVDDKKAEDDAGLTPPEPAAPPADPTKKAQASLLEAQADALRREPPPPPADRLPDVVGVLATMLAAQQENTTRMLAALATQSQEAAERAAQQQAQAVERLEAQRRDDQARAEAARAEAAERESRLRAEIAAAADESRRALALVLQQGQQAQAAQSEALQATIASLKTPSTSPELGAAVLQLVSSRGASK
jgi:lambda family phage portal protein